MLPVGPEAARIVVSGNWKLDDARELYEALRRVASNRAISHVDIDLSGASELDSAAVAAVRLGGSLLERRDKTWHLERLASDQRAVFAVVGERAEEPQPRAGPGALEQLGGQIPRFAAGARDYVGLVGHLAARGFCCFTGREKLRLDALVQQMVVTGVDAIPIVAVLGLLVGTILGFQAAFQLEQFGAKILMAEVVGLGMVREFAPLITAIILAGRSGAAMSAELATMRVNEEVDALESMGIDPVGYLVLPRVVALMLVQPLLTGVSMAVGILGGILIADTVGATPYAVFHRMQAHLFPADFVLGFGKSILFAWAIAMTSCFTGLRTRGGAHGVGRSTTRAVVISIVLIIVIDSAVTTIWTLTNV